VKQPGYAGKICGINRLSNISVAKSNVHLARKPSKNKEHINVN
jgi:hypothetical protein